MLSLYLILAAMMFISLAKNKVASLQVVEASGKKIEAFSKDNTKALKGFLLYAFCFIILGYNAG